MTTASQPENALDVQLSGDLLIDASAGTGKTYTLTTLVARLIVEDGRSIDQLLIVTFSNAAAGELRDRVWRTLQEARRAVATPDTPVGDQAQQLAARWRGADLQEAALRRLTSAIRDFDQGNITTIHGFCQRALSEFALQANIPFSFDVSGDDTLAVAAAVRDFWRKQMVDESIGLLEYAKSEKFVLDDKTTAWVGAHHAQQHEIRGVGPAEDFERDLESKRSKWREEVRSSRRAWSDRAQRKGFLEVTDPSRWLKKGRDPRRTRTFVDALDADALQHLPPNYAGFFGREALDSKLYQKQSPPPDPLYDCFRRLGEAGDEYGRYWLADRRRRLLADVRETLHHTAWAHRSLSFDDLLTELHRALHNAVGPTLAKQIRDRYPVLLVDEFQDTDRQQAEIFERIYAAGSEASEGRQFVVGDPKQSIYRFRGADVFAYFDARTRIRQSGQELTLARNYRSTPQLVRAVNTLFGRFRPFLLERPGFQASQAAERNSVELVVRDEEPGPLPFQIDLFLARSGRKPNKGAMKELTTQHAASEIAHLLALGQAEKAHLVSGEERRPVSGGDIAVLVRTGKQGKAVAAALREGFGIDSVEMGTDNVLDSTEAADLQRLLYALADETEYNATSRLRGALAAALFGLDMHELAGLRDNDDAWTRWRDLASRWSETWQEHGIAALLRHILFASETDCAANLLRYPDGPRRLTNFLHLTDLLHEAETRHRPSRQGLLDWFAHSRAESNVRQETAQLRLESDENLVKIVTIHRAKGLEFPVVFCPFTWDGHKPPAGRQRSSTAQHYDHDMGTPVLDLCPTGAAYDAERVEEHADELRLLYVALTRAQSHCVVTWAQANDAEHSPLAWLLHGQNADAKKPIEALNETVARVQKLSPDELLAEVHRFAGNAAGAVSVREIDPVVPPIDATTHPTEVETAETLKARKLGRKLEPIRQRTSYSALSNDAGAARSELELEGAEQPDHDPDDPDAADEVATAEPPGPEDDALNVFTFPSGSRPGKCLHEIFEKRLQPENENELDSISRDTLTRYRIDSKWEPVARKLVEDTLRTPLARPGEAGNVFPIADLERPIAEMEFHLPIEGLQRAELAQCLRDHGYDHSLPDSRTEINGFLHGYIDVVARHGGLWYVMDYKSNWLGRDLPAYSPAGLEKAMRRHGYHLQYLLYLTALHRLLRLRLPGYDYDRHIGGAFYLFVRGMRPASPGRGVFHDRPSRACIEAIDNCFGDHA